MIMGRGCGPRCLNCVFKDIGMGDNHNLITELQWFNGHSKKLFNISETLIGFFDD